MKKLCEAYGGYGETYFQTREDLAIGNVEFQVEGVYGQCGANILYDFEFRGTKEKPTTPEEFVETIRHAAKEKVAVLLASAVVGSELHRFLNVYPWSKGAIYKNPNSGNSIQIFELKV